MLKQMLKSIIVISLTVANLQALPDFTVYKDIKQKKVAFFNYLVPIIEEINNDIYEDRQYILGVLEQVKKHPNIKKREQNKIKDIFDKYHFNPKTQEVTVESLSGLLNRADVIPPSLVLAQAANESAWGTSAFAVKGNNLFGQWCYKKGCGIVPDRRGDGMRHEVRKFSSAKESIKSYIMNLNSHDAYVKLRNIRAKLRSNKAPLSGKVLASGLDRYSERGLEYTKEIVAMIKFNKLEQFNHTFV